MNNNRITTLFKQKKENILSIYFTAGYPTIDSTQQILKALQDEGVDLVEIGIPFSDPIADGEVIQHSSQIALDNGMKIEELFTQLTDIRKTINIPLVAMSYLNPILQFGFEKFCQSCQAVGIDGLIIPDLPIEVYLSDYKQIVEQYRLTFTFLITPETASERVRHIDQHTNGFLYMVSSPSITGTQNSFEQQKAYFDKTNKMNLKNPRLIGFGVSNKATYQMACQYASGAIIGSAFIKAIQEQPTIEKAVKQLIQQLKK